MGVIDLELVGLMEFGEDGLAYGWRFCCAGSLGLGQLKQAFPRRLKATLRPVLSNWKSLIRSQFLFVKPKWVLLWLNPMMMQV